MDAHQPPLWVPAAPAIVRATELPKTPAEARGIGHNGGPPLDEGFLGVMPVAAGKPPISLTYVNLYTTASTAATQSVTASFGAVPPTGHKRYIVAVVGNGQTAARTMTSATIGGNVATVHATPSSPGGALFALISAEVPAGATGSISCTWSGTPAAANRIAVFRLMNPRVATPYATSMVAAGSSGALNLDLNTVKGGVLIAGAQTRGDHTALSWTGATEQVGVDIGSGDLFSAAMLATGMATQTPRTLRATITPQSFSGFCGAAAVWR